MSVKAYYIPTSIKEASGLLRNEGGIPIAGGTDVMIKLRRGVIRNAVLVNIKNIPEIAGIREENGRVRIGSGTKISALAANPLIKERYPALAEGALSIGTPQIRNLGTIGGNACNASPCADTAPGLLVSEARVEISDGGGSREVDIDKFWTAPGKSVLEPGELVTGFLMPEPMQNVRQGFLKLGPRRAADIAVVNIAMGFALKDGVLRGVRISLGSVAPTPLRAHSAEALLEGACIAKLHYTAVAEAATKDVAPISDVRGSEWYRREAVAALVEQLLTKILGPQGR